MKNEIVEKKKDLLGARKQAYQQTFNKESIGAQKVLKDLAIYCHSSRTTFSENERVHAFREGQRDVWLRIQQHIQLTPEQLLIILGG